MRVTRFDTWAHNTCSELHRHAFRRTTNDVGSSQDAVVNADQSKTHQDSAMLARQLRCHSLHGSHTTQQHQHHLPLLRPCHPVHVPRSAVIAAATTEPQASPQRYDVLALSNLCVDIVLPVDELPPKDASFRQQLLQQLTDHPPSKEQWELGGNCNFMIAASRIGMRVGSIGHVGNDMYGDYLEEVLQAERVPRVLRLAPDSLKGTPLDQTLLCFVFVDPRGGHSFCSRYDFGPWPLLGGVQQLPPHVLQALQSTKAVFTNGFVFDELPLQMVVAAAQAASAAGAAVCFDPGPRCFTMRTGLRRAALDALMDLSDVVLMTLEEAIEVTGYADAELAARAVLARSSAKTRWCVVKEGAYGALLASRDAAGAFTAKALKVEVKDTVGCGDSFAAAVVLGYISQHSIPSTLVLANAVGAATAMGRGAGTNVASASLVKQLLVDALYGADHEQQHVEEALDILRSSLSSVDGDAAQGPAPGSSPAAAAAAGSSQGAQSSSTGAIPTSNCHAAASNGSSNGKGKGAGAARGTSSQAASAV